MGASEIILTVGATPATPGAGKAKLFVNASKQLAQVDDTGAAIALLAGGAASQATPANPTGTTNTSGLMMGLAAAITPSSTGRILIIIGGNLSNSTAAAGDGAKATIRYGTGSAPANAAALTGTTVGTTISMLLERATASDPYPFSCNAIVTGLTLGTAVWVDLQLAAITGGTAIVTNLSISIVEL